MSAFSRAVGIATKHSFLPSLPGTFRKSKLFQRDRCIPQFLNETAPSRRFSKDVQNQTAMECREIEIPIPGGLVKGKAWGSESAHPVLAFHGWQDNCGTFDRLIPLLSDQFYYVAIDAPGHGWSFHKPPGFVYTDISMIMDFKRVADSLGWKKFDILGHSLGGVLGLLFACVFPESVQKLAVLDVAKPFSSSDDAVPGLKFTGIKDHLKCEDKMVNKPPVYSEESAVKRLMKGMHYEVCEEGILILLKRGARASDCGTGLVYTRDMRMRPLELISVRSHDTTRSLMSSLQCELLIIMANNTHPKYTMESPEILKTFLDFYETFVKHFVVSHVEGNHFVHMNNPERVAPIINDFMLKDNSKS